MKIVVVGGGVFGVTSALELRRRGHQVALLDQGPLPHPQASSTDISKMIRMDYGADELYMALMEEAFEGWRAWNRAWGEELYHETGFLILAGGPMQPGGFEHESHRLLVKRSHRVDRLDARSLAERFPAWSSDRYPDGYFNPLAGWAESGRVVERLVQEASAAGVEVIPGVRVRRLVGTRVLARDGRRWQADEVVVAAGSWTPKLVPELAEFMEPVAQPVLHFRVPTPKEFQPPRFPPWAADIASTGWYGFPALADGTVKVANHGPGRLLDPDAPRRVGEDEEGRFRAFLRQAIPGLADAPLISGRLCLYCDTWDGNFWIDRHPAREGLLVATGGSGHGFKFAPVLGAIVADVLEGKPNGFAPRFAWRSRGERVTEDARHVGL